MAVCVSVTSALWEAEAGGFLRSLPMSSIPGLARVSVIGIKWGIIEQETGHMCSVGACDTHTHTHTIHRHLHTETCKWTFPSVQSSGKTIVVSACVSVATFSAMPLFLAQTRVRPTLTLFLCLCPSVPPRFPCIANTSYTFCISLYYLSHLHISSLYVCLYKHKLPHIKGVSSVLLSCGCQGLNSAHQVYLMSQRRSRLAAKFLNLFVFICITFINLGEGSIACTVGYLCRSKESLLVLLWAPAIEVKSCLETVVCTHWGILQDLH